MKDTDKKWVLMGEGENPIKAKNLITGNVTKSVVVNGDVLGNVENNDNDPELHIETVEGLKGDIDKLKDKISKIETKEKQKIVNNIFDKIKKCLFNHWVLIGIIIILLGTIIFNQYYEVTENNNVALILGFVGILATFVVISNYAQVQEAKNEVQNIKCEFEKATQKIKILEKILKDASFNEFHAANILYKKRGRKFSLVGGDNQYYNNNIDVNFKEINETNITFIDENNKIFEFKNNFEFRFPAGSKFHYNRKRFTTILYILYFF